MLGKNQIVLVMIFSLLGGNCTEKSDKRLNYYESICNRTLPSAYVDLRNDYQKKNITDKGKVPLIVLTGSSTIAKWTSLQEDLPGYHVLNRHFDGCYAWHLIYNLDVIAKTLQPDLVFIYTGDNDTELYPDNQNIYQDIQCLSQTLFSMVPHVRLVFISIKPSPLREKMTSRFRELNRYLESVSKERENVDYIDIWSGMFKADGTIDRSYFREDNIHLSSKGYQILSAKVREYLKEYFK